MRPNGALAPSTSPGGLAEGHSTCPRGAWGLRPPRHGVWPQRRACIATSRSRRSPGGRQMRPNGPEPGSARGGCRGGRARGGAALAGAARGAGGTRGAGGGSSGGHARSGEEPRGRRWLAAGKERARELYVVRLAGVARPLAPVRVHPAMPHARNLPSSSCFSVGRLRRAVRPLAPGSFTLVATWQPTCPIFLPPQVHAADILVESGCRKIMTGLGHGAAHGAA